MDYEQFYARCARLLDTEHDFHEPPGLVNRPRHDGSIRNTYKKRYNGREPGNGRFPGRGLVRHFGGGIHVSLRTPPLLGYYREPEEALAAIALALGVQETYSEAEIEQIKARRSEINAAAKAVVQANMPQVPNDIVIIAHYFRLINSDKASIAWNMGIHIPADSANDFERFKSCVTDIRAQGRMAELWSKILRYEEGPSP